jgi:hypothetical protein
LISRWLTYLRWCFSPIVGECQTGPDASERWRRVKSGVDSEIELAQFGFNQFLHHFSLPGVKVHGQLRRGAALVLGAWCF